MNSCNALVLIIDVQEKLSKMLNNEYIRIDATKIAKAAGILEAFKISATAATTT